MRAVRAERPAASTGVGGIGSGSDEDADAREAGSATSGRLWQRRELAPLPPSLLLAPLLAPPLARAPLPPPLLLLPPPPPVYRQRRGLNKRRSRCLPQNG